MRKYNIDNPILNVDSYKFSHFEQYPPQITHINSYIESRGGKFGSTLFFGLQAFIKEYLLKPITIIDIEEAEAFAKDHGVPFNKAGWMHILQKHDGYFPIKIQAVKEGSVIRNKNVLVQVINTDPNLPWLTSYIETALLRAVWYPVTVATTSWSIKQVIKRFAEETSDEPANLGFKLNDFGGRGVSSKESAGIGGAAHLVNFSGSDTGTGISWANNFYDEPMAGFSIPASEHSISSSWGTNEKGYVMRMLNEFAKPGKMLAMVADTYNIYDFCKMLSNDEEIKDKILNSGACTVIRPDCYDEGTEILTNSGFKEFKDLTEDDLVAQFNNDHTIDFTKPLKIINQPYEGKMYNFSTLKGRLDITVTPNHGMVVENNDNIDIIEAENVKFHNERNIIRKGKSNFVGNDLSNLERLFIAFQADGSFNSNGPKSKVRFNFTKERKFNRLIEICEKGNIEYKVSREPARPNNYQVYITIPENTTIHKEFDKWVDISKVSYNWCQQFIEELSYWDATIRSEKRIKYDTTVKTNADIVQQICVLGNKGCTYSIHKDNRSEKFSDVYSLTITDTNIGGQSVKTNVIDYKGNVYCVTVPSGMIIVRKNNKVIVSGNSGDPVAMSLKVVEMLWEAFGGTINSKGYKVLASCVRVIYGDGINEQSIYDILQNLKRAGFSSDNINFGMGGDLLQNVTRDTNKFAMKASAAIHWDGQCIDIFKDPITDPGKTSKKGILALIKDENGYQTIRESELNGRQNYLEVVYLDGKLMREQTFEEIRQLSNVA